MLAAYEMLSTSADVAEHLWRRLKIIAVEDEHLTSQPALAALVTAALGRITERLPAAGTVEVTSPGLDQRADRACAGNTWYVPGALATWTGHVADALHDLVTGRLPLPSEGFWFVDGDGRRIRPVHRS